MSYQRPYDEAIYQDNAGQRQWESGSLNLSYQTRETLSKAICHDLTKWLSYYFIFLFFSELTTQGV